MVNDEKRNQGGLISETVIYSQVLGVLRDAGIYFSLSGPAKNVLSVQTLPALFHAGNLLFRRGFVLENLATHARRYGVSRQAAFHWVHRDGTRLALSDGSRGVFVVDKCNGKT